MKKVLSVAMASAMVLGMGANAFAIQYNVSSNDTAEWPTNFEFAGSLFVTDKDGKVKKDATTAITTDKTADFAPGDVIWMPLYADDQVSYDLEGGTNGTIALPAITGVKVEAAALDTDVAYADSNKYELKSGKYVVEGTTTIATVKDNQYFYKMSDGKYRLLDVTINDVSDLKDKTGILENAAEGREGDISSVKYVYNNKQYNTLSALCAGLQKANVGIADAEANITALVDLKAVAAEEGTAGDISSDANVAYGVYTGPIDKNWSINLIEEKGKASELIEKAELYRATTKDAKNYGAAPRGVYVKVTLKEEWPSVETVNLKYHVYISENGTENKTNKVWVSGDYANTNVKTVDFTWTNDANTPAVWKAEENGEAVFDYNDKAFFTVKMYEGEKMYLDLKTAYDRLTANAIYDATGAEVDSFFQFVTGDANFSREGTLVLVTDDETLVPYKVLGDGEYEEVEAEYVENYKLGNTNKKVNGFMFNTKELGNYILSEELTTEEEVEEVPEVEEPATETPAEPEAPVVEEKPNPNTGAEDFVGLAVSLAVVSVAAAGALALKK